MKAEFKRKMSEKEEEIKTFSENIKKKMKML